MAKFAGINNKGAAVGLPDTIDGKSDGLRRHYSCTVRVNYRESDFGYGRAIFVARVSRFKSAGSRFRGDQTAENGMVSGSSMIGRKTTFA